MEEQKEKLERIYQKLNEEEDTVLKKWYESIIPKIILLFPSIAFALTFLKVNTDKSILDLIIFIAVGGLLVAGGIFLNYFLSLYRRIKEIQQLEEGLNYLLLYQPLLMQKNL